MSDVQGASSTNLAYPIGTKSTLNLVKINSPFFRSFFKITEGTFPQIKKANLCGTNWLSFFTIL